MCYLNCRRRNINGIILLDKPSGISSNALLQKVKRLFRANKAGHTGSLDPLATGMLPICFGEATKFAQYLIDTDKRYLVTAKLGERTDTSDAKGQIISIRPVLLNEDRLKAALVRFQGQHYQVPSMFSAIKYQGRPLYEYARKGITVPRKSRPIKVYDLQLLYWNQTHISLKIFCSKGTYIRTIIDDLGEYLECGAHVTALRRLTVACYTTKCMVTLEKLQAVVANTAGSLDSLNMLLLPIESAIKNMIPTVNLEPNIALRIKLGQTVSVSAQQQISGPVILTEGEKHRFFGIGKIITPGYLMPQRLITE